jgi:hypothetical protein
MIGCWADKDDKLFWRPITTIREAASDATTATVAQADWLPFFPLPCPEHPSATTAIRRRCTRGRAYWQARRSADSRARDDTHEAG